MPIMGKKKKKNKIGKEISSEELIQFIGSISQLDIVSFVGILKILCIEYAAGQSPRAMDEIFSEIIDKYLILGKRQRKEINQVIGYLIEDQDQDQEEEEE